MSGLNACGFVQDKTSGRFCEHVDGRSDCFNSLTAVFLRADSIVTG